MPAGTSGSVFVVIVSPPSPAGGWIDVTNYGQAASCGLTERTRRFRPIAAQTSAAAPAHQSGCSGGKYLTQRSRKVLVTHYDTPLRAWNAVPHSWRDWW